MIFQLPYMKNFENGPQNKMWDYTLLRGPLHSKTLKFSYGAGYGTENDNWYKATSELEPDAMVAELRARVGIRVFAALWRASPPCRR